MQILTSDKCVSLLIQLLLLVLDDIITLLSWKLQIIKSDRFVYLLIAIIFVWHIFLDDFNFHIENNIFNHYDIVDIL